MEWRLTEDAVEEKVKELTELVATTDVKRTTVVYTSSSTI